MKRKSGRQLIQQGCTTLVKRKQIVITVVLLTAQLLLLFGIFSQLPAPGPTSLERDTTAVDYNTFLAQVRAGNVLVASLHDQEMVGALVRPLTEGQKTSSSRTKVTQQQAISYLNAWYYTPSGDVPGQGIGAATASPPLQSVQLISTRLPESGDAELMPLLLGKHVVIKVQLAMQPPRWLSQIWKLLPCLLLLLMLPQFPFPSKHVRFPGAPGDFISFRSTRNQTEAERQNAPAPKAHLKGASAGDKVVRARASSQVFPELEPPQITFADVAGIDQVRQEVQELVQFLRAPERFERLGARLPGGALLVGPPGTDKTLLAKAVAGEAGVPFFSVSASEFVEMYVGMGAKRVRELFYKAHEHAPCVIFIDELDAVGRKRHIGPGGSDERDQTLNQLLVELDGFAARQAIVVLAATNRADILDPALLRPGRFDRHISVSLPDRAGRQAILQVHTRYPPWMRR